MIDKQAFKEQFFQYLKTEYHKTPKTASPHELHTALSKTVMGLLANRWMASTAKHNRSKKACYFSAEFLMGRAVYNNLLCLGIAEPVQEIFKECGIDFSALEEVEDAALGNGGLGRLAACFLDSAATLNLPLDGYGIRYKYGLFEQRFENGFQQENADNWTRHGDPWSIRCDSDIVRVQYADQTVYAVPYDMPIIGYGTENIGNLRLWQAEPLEEFNFLKFNEQKYGESVQEKDRAEDISRVLYPNDSTPEGKKLRLKQQYFFSSASLQDILRTFKQLHGADFSEFSEYYTVQLNDTHPVISIPELIRLLIDCEGLAFPEAFEIAQKTFAYTNHTIMAEALETWDIELMVAVVPRIVEIIEMINEHLLRAFRAKGLPLDQVKNMRIISYGWVHMARLAVYASSYTNGVAQIHSELIKKTVLADWYAIYPERFQNKTNGITQRRWLALCNQELSAFISKLLCNEDWKTDLSELEKLVQFADNTEILEKFIEIKRTKKEQLADAVWQRDSIKIDPDQIFDIQIKRLHEYKRQMMNAFSILAIYFGIKDGSITDFHPTTFLFGAKAAPGYDRAKAIIKLIHEVGRLIEQDKEVREKMQVVFVSNYNVSYAEKMVAAADISEQISTAGTEASGTGNMKFMLNGTVTLGTLDGANVEIVEEAGAENNYIFGAHVEDIDAIQESYDPNVIYDNDPLIKRVVDSLIDGTLDDGDTGMFKELYDALLKGASWHKPDHYYLLLDLKSYVETKLRANRDYGNPQLFARKCWLNLCGAGKFSSDRTISDYARDIWHIRPVK